MAKRRKRVSKAVPSKGRLREYCDRLWSIAVKADWNHTCAICGRHGDLNSHHLIPRHHYGTRYVLENGLSLCRHCHVFCPHHSPHLNAGAFIAWLESDHPDRAEWLFQTLDTGQHLFTGTKNATFFCDTIRELEPYVEPEDYRRIVGVRFSTWLEEQETF